ncbi:MAG TPA: glycosyltransferase family 4 protein [Actinomycetota bacterium]
MRILQIVNLGYVAGGAEKSVQVIRDAMVARGHEVLVLSTDKGLEGEDSFADVVIPRIAGNAVKRLTSYAWYGAGRKAILAAIRRFAPDVVHLHTIGEFSPAVFWALGGVPAVLTVHGPEEFMRQLLTWQLPASDYRNGSFEWADLTLVGRLRYTYQRFLQRPLYLVGARRHLRLILAPSRFMAGILEQDAPGIPVRLLYNGIPLPAAEPLPEHPQVLYVGRLEPVKGVDPLLHAMQRLMARIPTATLVVVGEGSQRTSLEALSARLGLSGCVRFAGWVAPKDIGPYYAAAQVVAVPSLCPETLAMVTVEAMAFGRPVVGSNVGGIPEVVVDTVTGNLVKPGDAEALADALAGILGDAVRARRMSIAAREASEAFGAQQFLDALEETYRELARSRPRQVVNAWLPQ